MENNRRICVQSAFFLRRSRTEPASLAYFRFVDETLTRFEPNDRADLIVLFLICFQRAG